MPDTAMPDARPTTDRGPDPRRPTAEGRLMPPATLRALGQRSDARGALQTGLHLALLVAGGLLVGAAGGTPWLLPAMALHGIAVAALFGALHEGVHFTAFRTRGLNLGLAWLAGATIGSNAEIYRLYHHAHHRYTQDPTRDPELGRPKPATLGAYALRLLGWGYWIDRLRATAQALRGDFSRMPFVPAAEQAAVTRSVRAMVALYGLVALASLALGSAAALVYWVIPLLLGTMVLRIVLLAEHTGCSHDGNGLTNTRTTLTWWPVRLLYWNLPFHAEHHLYPSLPFHALPKAHRLVRDRLAHVAPGYLAVHRDLIASLATR